MDRDHRRTLTKCHLNLIDLLNPKDYVVDHLISEEILASSERDQIMLKPTTKEQAREFMNIVPHKGSKAWDELIVGLLNSEAGAHHEAAKILRDTLAIVQAGRSPRPERHDTTQGDGSAMSHHTGAGSGTTHPDWPLGGGGAGGGGGRSDGGQLTVTVNLDDRADVYKMSSQPRGRAYVINNKNFARSSGMPKRNGTDVDMDALDQLWTKLGFETRIFKDQAGGDLRYELGRLAKEDHTGRDCVVVSILSHGVEGKLYGSDGDLVPVEDLIELFNNDVVHKSLIGKPKLFFLQACRGDYFDKGSDLPDGDALVDMMLQDEASTTIDGKLRSLPSAADMFVGYATVPGFVSWRNSERGSWFVQSIVKTFNEHMKEEHLLDMMVRVNNMVASEFEASGHNKQIPSPVVRLTKKLYFRPGHFARK